MLKFQNDMSKIRFRMLKDYNTYLRKRCAAAQVGKRIELMSINRLTNSMPVCEKPKRTAAWKIAKHDRMATATRRFVRIYDAMVGRFPAFSGARCSRNALSKRKPGLATFFMECADVASLGLIGGARCWSQVSSHILRVKIHWNENLSIGRYPKLLRKLILMILNP